MSENYEETINDLESRLATARKLYKEMNQEIDQLKAENKRLANKANSNIMDQLFTFREKIEKNMPQAGNTEFKEVKLADEEWMRGEAE